MLKTNRQYSCKNEELLPISKFTLFSLKRDIAEFTAFSNQFNEQYVIDLEAVIKQVESVIEPEADTLALKLLTQKNEQYFLDLQKELLIIEGYLKLAKKEIKITPSAFGLTSLRKSYYKHDLEAVLNGIKIVTANVQTYSATLEAKGMPVTLIKTMQDIHVAIAENKQKQFEIRTGRADLVQNNQQVLNNLYFRLSEIYTIGKVLYKTSNPAKYNDYTFTKLLKKVRRSTFDVKSSTTEVPTNEVLSPMS
jgi:hypothetical protein